MPLQRNLRSQTRPVAGQDISAPTSSSSTTNASSKQRRSHKKSRNGCAECKRRHIRCDEARPACANCTMAERTCAYPLPARAATGSQLMTPSSQSASPPSDERVSGMLDQPFFGAGSSDSAWSSLTMPSQSGQQLDAQFQEAMDLASTPSDPLTLFNEVYQQQQLSSMQSQDLGELPTNVMEHHFHIDHQQTSPGESVFRPDHLKLLLHISQDMHGGIMSSGRKDIVVRVAVRDAAEAPYLIDQVLALSAMHLATQPEQGNSFPLESPAYYRQQGRELQNRAVAKFTQESQSMPDPTYHCIQRFLFSGILSLHVLAETLSYITADVDSKENGDDGLASLNTEKRFSDFLDSFAECFDLHRGVLIVIRPDYEFLLNSEVSEVLIVTQQAREHILEREGTECRPLERLLGIGPAMKFMPKTHDPRQPNKITLDKSNLPSPENLGPLAAGQDPLTIAACRGAVALLQWSFNFDWALGDYEVPHAVSSWAIRAPVEYVVLIRQRNPVALAILAYYAVLLHRASAFWVIGPHKGAAMVRAIARYLGPEWAEVMSWPLERVNTEPPRKIKRRDKPSLT